MTHHNVEASTAVEADAHSIVALREQLVAEIDRELPLALEVRQELHQNPEVSGEEHSTSQRLRELVDFKMEKAADTGFVGRFGPAEGPSVLVRAELDALPVVEETGVSWASTNGAMHACGHDVHMAAWVAFCRAASRIKLPKAVTAVLQPREEAYPSGAHDIVSEGWLERLQVDSAIAVHVHPAIYRGELAIGAGAINAAADTLKVTYRGRGGHGAYPHLAASPVPALVALAAALPQLHQHVVDPTESGVITVGKLSAGDAANVIPSEGRLEATIRTMSNDTRARLYRAITELVHSTASAWDLEVEMAIEEGEPVLINEPAFALRAQRQTVEIGLEVASGIYSCGSDDFSYFSERVPSLMIFAGVETVGERVNLHSPHFLPEQETIRTVALGYIAGYLASLEGALVNDDEGKEYQ